MAISLVNYSNYMSTGRDMSVSTASGFPAVSGDIFVVKQVTEDANIPMAIPTSSGLTFIEQYKGPSSGSSCWEGIWTCLVPSSGTRNITGGAPTGNCMHGFTVELWRSAKLDPSPLLNSPKTGSGGTTLTNMTTSVGNSIISWVCGDKAYVNPTGRVYNSTTGVVSQEQLYNGVSNTSMSAYFAWQTAPSAGVQNIGLTTPTGMNWSIAAIELKYDVPSVSAVATFNGSGSFGGTVTVITPPTPIATFNGTGTFGGTNGLGIGVVATFNSAGYLVFQTNNMVNFNGEGTVNFDAGALLPDPPQMVAFVQIGKQTGYGTVRSPNNLKYPARLPFGDYSSIQAMRNRLKTVKPNYYTDYKLNTMTLNDIIHALIEQDTVK